MDEGGVRTGTDQSKRHKRPRKNLSSTRCSYQRVNAAATGHHTASKATSRHHSNAFGSRHRSSAPNVRWKWISARLATWAAEHLDRFELSKASKHASVPAGTRNRRNLLSSQFYTGPKTLVASASAQHPNRPSDPGGINDSRYHLGRYACIAGRFVRPLCPGSLSAFMARTPSRKGVSQNGIWHCRMIWPPFAPTKSGVADSGSHRGSAAGRYWRRCERTAGGLVLGAATPRGRRLVKRTAWGGEAAIRLGVDTPPGRRRRCGEGFPTVRLGRREDRQPGSALAH